MSDFLHSDLMQIVMAVGVVVALVLHKVGKKHPTAEKAAEVIDEGEQMGK
jgi:hypothetical protein